MIKRSLGSHFPKKISFFLFGPRQTGKSTLIRTQISPEESITIDLLKTDTYLQFKTRPSFLHSVLEGCSSNTKIVFIDEVQRIPELLNEVQVNLTSERPFQFILSGSSARKLKRSHANLLGGRAALLKLFPFSYIETKSSGFSLNDTLTFGMLPPLWNMEKSDRTLFLKSYIETYIKEEIQTEALTRNLPGFMRFLTLSANENGSLVNFTGLSQDSGVGLHMIREFYQILEDTLLCVRLDPFSSRMRRLVKHSRYYYIDIGIVNALCNRLPPMTIQPGTSLYGAAFEHFIILELFKIKESLNRNFKLFFYRSASGAEVDVILEKQDNSYVAIEIKSGQNPEPSNVTGLKSFQGLVQNSRVICVHTGDFAYTKDDIEFLPWTSFLDEVTEF
jgi:predicted AAA+ superfamily ATPase